MGKRGGGRGGLEKGWGLADLVRSLLNCLHLLSTYSRMVRIILMMARMSEPNATVPRWKRVACHMDLARVKDGTFSFFIVQYHCTHQEHY